MQSDGVSGREGTAIAGLGERGEGRVKGRSRGVAIERVEAHFFNSSSDVRWDLLVVVRVRGRGGGGRDMEAMGERASTAHVILCV